MRSLTGLQLLLIRLHEQSRKNQFGSCEFCECPFARKIGNSYSCGQDECEIARKEIEEAA